MEIRCGPQAAVPPDGVARPGAHGAPPLPLLDKAVMHGGAVTALVFTDKALNGLFLMLAEEEKKIRENPASRTTELLQKVFGSK